MGENDGESSYDNVKVPSFSNALKRLETLLHCIESDINVPEERCLEISDNWTVLNYKSLKKTVKQKTR